MVYPHSNKDGFIRDTTIGTLRYTVEPLLFSKARVGVSQAGNQTYLQTWSCESIDEAIELWQEKIRGALNEASIG